MDGKQLASLVDERHKILCDLVQLSQSQLEAIDAGRMNELMHLLSAKQPPLAKLASVSQQLHIAIGDDPEMRMWSSPQRRSECRKKNEQCEQMLAELMEMESSCETKLVTSRAEIEQRIQRSDGVKRANQSYRQSDIQPSCGGQLDLSSQ
ncbi:flagellar export chaperone FlgN [Novipirellula artificiosorum]|uniref:FlgN protein n=1 Tax=Novipirellula artificiosorum TaxID=2528016 RepID=A0A5C6E1R9_9BACT|nr:flagellar export chaperone FlgN [Novipirellula artificiosorum]TWU41937.1 FlgN protein [Novipirellula artificiosorum]